MDYVHFNPVKDGHIGRVAVFDISRVGSGRDLSG